MYIWDARTAALIKTIPVVKKAYGPTDRLLETLGRLTWGLIRPHNDVSRYDVAREILYSSDGKLLIAGGMGGVNIYSATSYKLLRSLNASGPIALFPDNNRLVTAAPITSRDIGKVEVWTISAP